MIYPVSQETPAVSARGDQPATAPGAAPGLAPVGGRAVSLVDRIAAELRTAIVRGRLRPGERLPISQLAATLQTSQVPVREALQRLAGDGLVVLQASRSAVVAPVSGQDLREIYRLRLLIEVDAAARAAPLLRDQNLGDLARHLDELGRAPAESEGFWAHHDAFHRALLLPVMTPRLGRLIDDLWRAGQRYTRLAYARPGALRASPALHRHARLLDAARTRSGPAVGGALREHLAFNEAEMDARLARTGPGA